MTDITIYTSGSGGNFIQQKTTQLNNLVLGLVKKEAKIVYIDMPGTEDIKKMIREKTGKLGVWPLLFKGDNYIGTLDDCVDLNEAEELKPMLL